MRALLPTVALGGLLVGLLPAGAARAAPTQPGELVNALVRADDCEYCHTYNNATDAAADPLYSPYWTWRGSMMANAAVDPVFWAGVAVASQDAQAPEETQACIRCHAPRAFLEGRGDAIAVDELLGEDLVGVECEVCHRMESDGGIGNGQYAIDDTLVGANVPRRGPWTYGMGTMYQPPPHSWIQDDFVGSSEACGTCHDVTTPRPRLDDEGNPVGGNFNEQRTYSEWAGSAFAQPGEDFRSCQDCHMPAVADMPGCRDNVDVRAHETGGRRHDLVGANRFMIELLSEDATVLEGIGFDHTLAVIDDFVRTAATVEIEAPPSVDLGQGLRGLSVTVTNETGHKLPTGYSEGRVMWIELVARHEGEVLWSSGVWDQAAGAMQDDPQLRTYRGVAEAYATGESLHLLRNDHWIEDTRIPPRGLMPDLETDPVGGRYAVQDDGSWPNFDVAPYTFEGVSRLADVDAGELEISARLLYLINTPAYVEFLAAANQTNDAGNDVAMLFEAAGGATPMVVAEATLTVPIEPLVGGSTTGGSTGEGGTAADDSTGVSTDPTDPSAGPSTSMGTEDGSSSSAAVDEDGGGEGCGCTSGTSGRAGAGWLLALFIWLRRRRRCA